MDIGDDAFETEDYSEDPSDSALHAAESFIAGSPESGTSCDGSGAAFTATFSALAEWGEQRGLIREETEFAFFARQPDGHGDEHQAWFHPESRRWFKATYPNRFGLAWGRDDTATPHEYLRRLILQNIYFGDDIRLVALANCGGKLRVVTSQPHIAGEPAAYDEIQQWFVALEFTQLNAGNRIAWYYAPENLLVADAHEGNVIRTPHESLIPIDLNIIQPIGALWESVIALLPLPRSAG